MEKMNLKPGKNKVFYDSDGKKLAGLLNSLLCPYFK
jgi:hypothetical protein